MQFTNSKKQKIIFFYIMWIAWEKKDKLKIFDLEMFPLFSIPDRHGKYNFLLRHHF